MSSTARSSRTARSSSSGPDAAEQGRVRPRRAQAEGAQGGHAPGPRQDPAGAAGPARERRPAQADRGRRQVPGHRCEIPTFPMPVLDEDRESKRNQELLKTTQGLIADIKAQRAESYKRQGAELEKFGGKVLDTYWLIQGAHVSLPLGQVRELAASDELEYIELADGVAKPPADANPDNDLIDARAQIQSDPYFNLNQTSGWIGLLDTGVRETPHGVQPARPHLARAGPERRRQPVRPVQPRHRVGRPDHRQRPARRQLARRVRDLGRLLRRLRQRLPRRRRRHGRGLRDRRSAGSTR